MALHTPAHHAGIAGHHYGNMLLGVVLAAVAVVMLVAVFTVKIPAPAATFSEAESIVSYRAAERADWAAGVTTEGQSLIEFRASERNER